MIDASVAVRAVVPAVAPFDTLELIRGWRRRRIRLLSPSLFLAESTLAIRRFVQGGVFSVEEGSTALSDLLNLEIEIIAETAEHCKAAFRWAARLGQSKVYDGFYLAVAEQNNTELWTADERLTRLSRDNNITWVRYAGETETETTT